VRLEKLLEHIRHCLELNWRNTKVSDKHIENINDAPSLPDQKTMETLKNFAQTGYLNGVLECIEQFESQYAQTQWLTQLKKLSAECDLHAVVGLIDELKTKAENQS